MAEEKKLDAPIEDNTDQILSKLSNLSSGIKYEYEDEPLDQLEGEKKEQEIEVKKEEPEENPLIKAIEQSKVKKEEVVEEKPVIDPDKMKTDVVAEVVKTVTGKTPEELAKEKEETPVWVKENREPTQKEVLDYTKEQTKRELRAEMEAERQAKEQESEKVVKEQQTVEEQSKERARTALEMMGRDVAELAVDGKLPAVTDENNPEDVGLKARNDLYTQFANYAIPAWNAYNKAVSEGKTPDPLPLNTQNIRLFYYEKFKPTYDKPQAGKDAPVAGVVQEAFAGDTDQDEFSYDEILEARKKGALSLIKSN
jgi:hypothetical protein